MNLEEKKKAIEKLLLEVESDIAELTERVEAAKAALKDVTTDEEAEEYEEELGELEDGLIHIMLF